MHAGFAYGALWLLSFEHTFPGHLLLGPGPGPPRCFARSPLSLSGLGDLSYS